MSGKAEHYLHRIEERMERTNELLEALLEAVKGKDFVSKSDMEEKDLKDISNFEERDVPDELLKYNREKGEEVGAYARGDEEEFYQSPVTDDRWCVRCKFHTVHMWVGDGPADTGGDFRRFYQCHLCYNIDSDGYGIESRSDLDGRRPYRIK